MLHYQHQERLIARVFTALKATWCQFHELFILKMVQSARTNEIGTAAARAKNPLKTENFFQNYYGGSDSLKREL